MTDGTSSVRGFQALTQVTVGARGRIARVLKSKADAVWLRLVDCGSLTPTWMKPFVSVTVEGLQILKGLHRLSRYLSRSKSMRRSMSPIDDLQA
jgi:hypothetical protein